MSNANPKTLAKRSGGSPATPQAVVAFAAHSGPLPDPATLANYERLVPGTAERILRWAEQEAEHRRALEREAVAAQAAEGAGALEERRRGQWMGLSIAALTVSCGTYTAVSGLQWAGSILGTAGLVGLVAVFVYGSHQRNGEK